ncbi:SDR family oxidoreductase [Alsobacter sp. R-9]
MTPIAPRLAGRFALITGASRGIGRAVAVRFAAEGATVAVNHFRDAGAAQETVAAAAAASAASGHGARPHLAFDADVASETAVEAMVEGCLAAWGRLDILVNNAGMQTPTPGDSFVTADLRKVLSIDLEGPAYCARAAIRHFLSRPGGGTVINTTSVHEIVPKPGYAAYAMAKGGLGHLTRTLALEFADKDIRVNAVGPGAVVTDMNAAWTGDARARAGVESHIPMGFAADAERDIAPVFAFLASDDARYITGQTIFACGGITLFGDFKQNWAS